MAHLRSTDHPLKIYGMVRESAKGIRSKRATYSILFFNEGEKRTATASTQIPRTLGSGVTPASGIVVCRISGDWVSRYSAPGILSGCSAPILRRATPLFAISSYVTLCNSAPGSCWQVAPAPSLVLAFVALPGSVHFIDSNSSD